MLARQSRRRNFIPISGSALNRGFWSSCTGCARNSKLREGLVEGYKILVAILPREAYLAHEFILPVWDCRSGSRLDRQRDLLIMPSWDDWLTGGKLRCCLKRPILKCQGIGPSSDFFWNWENFLSGGCANFPQDGGGANLLQNRGQDVADRFVSEPALLPEKFSKCWVPWRKKFELHIRILDLKL